MMVGLEMARVSIIAKNKQIGDEFYIAKNRRELLELVRFPIHFTKHTMDCIFNH